MSAGIFGAIFLGAADRSIGTIIPDVVVEEGHNDTLIITQHPIEMGAAVTDHAFAQPSVVVIRCGFSDSSAGSLGYAQAIYEEFLSWRQRREPRDVITGKRAYRNMLPANIGVITDDHTENVLALTIACQEVIIVSTKTTGTGTDTAGGGSNMVVDGGERAGSPVGSQDFAGAFNPGNFDTGGGVLGNGYFDLDGVSSGGTVEVGPITIESSAIGGAGAQVVAAASFSVFGT